MSTIRKNNNSTLDKKKGQEKRYYILIRGVNANEITIVFFKEGRGYLNRRRKNKNKKEGIYFGAPVSKRSFFFF